MADNDLKPATGADLDTPPATTNFEPAAPLKTSGVDFVSEASAEQGTSGGGDSASRTADARQAIRDGAGKIQAQAGEKLRLYADDGKAKAGDALDQLSQLLTDAAGQVDEKLGEQYGQYARNVAGQVQGFADTVKNKNVDDLLDDAREFVRASPAVAVGVAAAIGFAVARLVQSGLDTGSSAERG